MIEYPIIEDFFVNNAYVLKLVVSIALYCHFFERRQHFALRFLVVLVGFLTVSMLINGWKSQYESPTYVLIAYSIGRYVLAFILALNEQI